MKGAIGNAFILNMVITFMLIFYTLLIGSMAYSKAYRTKNYLINLIDEFERNEISDFSSRVGRPSPREQWDEKANEYLGKVGYPISTNEWNNCPTNKDKYDLFIGNGQGRYDYCIYRRGDIFDSTGNKVIRRRYNYMVIVYMKFDIPAIGEYIKIPIRGETKQYTIYR
jgi:hypothetical protein